MPKALADLTLTLPYNDLDAAKALFAAHGDEIAALIIEPVAGNMNCIPPRDGYLQALRDLCTQHGALLIFDEVMTGFRVALGGAQALLRRHARPEHVRQDHRRRHAGRRVRRPARDHAADRAGRPGLPGRHAERQSGGDGRGPGDAGADPGTGFPRAA